MGDWAIVAGKAKRFDDISPSFEEVAAGREARAREAEQQGNEVTARECYLVASIYYGVAQWPIDEINERNLTLNARKLDCYARYAVRAHHKIERVEIPMRPGSAIINTASINSDIPNPTLLAYATTKGAIQNFTAGLAQLLAEKGIRANTVAPGPIWTPLIPSTMPEDAVTKFGKQVPMQRPGQPAELATAYVMLADPLSSYVSGATIAVTGGKPIL